MSFPYTYFRCPCADEAVSEIVSEEPAEVAEQGDSFDPHALRANFSLYPLSHLLWCEDCQNIRCPRCVVEEVVCWYCPSCLFEVPSSVVRSEGNRCTRNCFNCPLCIAPLSVNSLNVEFEGTAGPWILMCEYCHWNTLELGIQFDRPQGIHTQLKRTLSGKQASHVSARTVEIEPDSISDVNVETPPAPTDIDSRFSTLLSFYRKEFGKANPGDFLTSPGSNTNSPSNLQRLMAIYTNQPTKDRKTSTRASFTHESTDGCEGLIAIDAEAEESAINKLRTLGFDGTTNTEQRMNQANNPRFVDELRPVATPLCTKRSRRCRSCRHILVRPEQRVVATRYRIKLAALNYVPSMTIKPLATSNETTIDFAAMPPSRPLQLLLTLMNPLFDGVKVTLGTPPQTPGRFSSRVTILCPQFEIGANADVWEEALGDGKRSSRLLGKVGKPEDGAESKIAEAGKVWEKGRNWTTVVVEVVCARIECPTEELGDDEDILEIPIFVRLEYEADGTGEAGKAGLAQKEKQEKRGLSYWAVIGVGKIAARPIISPIA